MGQVTAAVNMPQEEEKKKKKKKSKKKKSQKNGKIVHLSAFKTRSVHTKACFFLKRSL